MGSTSPFVCTTALFILQENNTCAHLCLHTCMCEFMDVVLLPFSYSAHWTPTKGSLDYFACFTFWLCSLTQALTLQNACCNFWTIRPVVVNRKTNVTQHRRHFPLRRKSPRDITAKTQLSQTSFTKLYTFYQPLSSQQLTMNISLHYTKKTCTKVLSYFLFLYQILHLFFVVYLVVFPSKFKVFGNPCDKIMLTFAFVIPFFLLFLFFAVCLWNPFSALSVLNLLSLSVLSTSCFTFFPYR